MKIYGITLGGMSGNCYLLKGDAGHVLVDTGSASKRGRLAKELQRYGCNAGDLKLILLTHGDFDHTGNCAYLRREYNVKVAMHRVDAGMVEQGDMFLNRKTGNPLIKTLVNAIFRIEKFTPDIFADEELDLSTYGLDAKILALPGHSKGSIGLLTESGDLFCGDLFENTKKPVVNSMQDDLTVAITSVEKLKGCNIVTVYPGHGSPFPIQAVL